MSIAEARQRAMRLERFGNHRAAIEAWRDVLSEDPAQADAHARLSMALLKVGRMKGAESEAKATLRLDPISLTAMLTLATKALIEFKPRKTFAQLDHLLSVAPYCVEALVLRAQALRTFGRNAEAAEAIAHALDLAPDDESVLVERGWHARGQRDYATVEEIAGAILSHNPEHVAALTLIGYARLDRGDRESALDAAVSALTADPTDREALELIATIKITRNPLAGIYWHLLRAMSQLSENKRWLIAGTTYLLYLMTLSTIPRLGGSEIATWSFVAVYLFISIGIIATREIIEWQVRRQSRRVQFGGY